MRRAVDAVGRSLAPMLFIVSVCVSLAGCVSTTPDRSGIVPSYAFGDTTNTRLHRHHASASAAHPSQSGFRLLANGLDAFVARLGLIDLADRSIDLQYYIFAGDQAGAIVAHRLLLAADRGVRVRILLDDVGKQTKDLHLLALQAHPRVEVRVFNPVFTRSGLGRITELTARFGRVNRRMHNKLLVADGLAMITGGRNIGEEYFSAAPTDFQDIDVFGVGPIAQEAQKSFDEYWNYDESYPLELVARQTPGNEQLAELRAELNKSVEADADSQYTKSARDAPLAEEIAGDRVRLVWAVSRMLYDPPAKMKEPGSAPTEGYLGGRIAGYIERPVSELLIMSAYFVPGDVGVDAFAALETNGVNVKVLTNSLAATDVAIVHTGYTRYRVRLLQRGISLFELKPRKTRTSLEIVGGSSRASLHAKCLVFDRRIVYIGSLNIDPRSVEQNTENGVVIGADEIAGEVARLFELWTSPEYAYHVELEKPSDAPLGETGKLRWTATEQGHEQVFYNEPRTSFWRRAAIKLLRVAPIDSQI